MTLHSLPIFVRLEGRAVILVGEGAAADAKRRLLTRAGASVVGGDDTAALAIVALDSPEETVARLKARGVLVNAVDRPELCDFTLPAIIDRDPVIVAIGTGGVSAGLAAALRQRFEALLPAGLGRLAERLHAMRGELRTRFPDPAERRRAIAGMLSEDGPLDPLCHAGPVPASMAPQAESLADDWMGGQIRSDEIEVIRLRSSDPDDLTLRQARALANADRIVHAADVPSAILDRARADAVRIVGTALSVGAAGSTVVVEMAS